MPTVLFVHNGTPGRFAGIAEALRRRGWSGALLNGPAGNDLQGYTTYRWQTDKGINREPIDPSVRPVEAAIEGGRQTVRLAASLKSAGFKPDIIIGHPGWGEMLFLKEEFPEVPQIQVAEYYYHSSGADVGFDPEFSNPNLQSSINLHARNMPLAISYLNAELLIAPTDFQKSLLPTSLHDKTMVIHEGIDTGRTKRLMGVAIRLKDGRILNQGDQIITFINRFFEPMRGFHIFMRSLPSFLKSSPRAHVILIGSDQSSGYGIKLKDETWKQRIMSEIAHDLDMSRVHFVNHVSYSELISILSASLAHVYLTYPFILSWSILDAMACSCLVVASETAPVKEIIQNGQNGILTDFFDTAELARKLSRICETPNEFSGLREAARKTVVQGYDRDTICLPLWLAEIERLSARTI